MTVRWRTECCHAIIVCNLVVSWKGVGLQWKWPFTEWETGPAPGKCEREWKMAPGLKWPKNGHRKNGPRNGTLAIFPSSAAIFRPFQAWGHFPFSFPFSQDFCGRPVSHSVNGHFHCKSGMSLWAMQRDNVESLRCEYPPLRCRIKMFPGPFQTLSILEEAGALMPMSALHKDST